MKKAIRTLFAIFVMGTSMAQEGKPLEAAVSESVVRIQHSIMLDFSQSKARSTWQRFEKITGMKIIDADIPYLVRSGFFVSEDGIIVTDLSAVQPDYVENAREAAIKTFSEEIEKTSLLATERATLVYDFKLMALSAKASFKVFSGTTDLGDVEILEKSDDTKADFALLRAAGRKFKPLRLAKPSAAPLKIKITAYAAGFSAHEYLKPPSFALKGGSITGLRLPTIINSASVDRGFVGGPLIDAKGDVLGVIFANRSSAGESMCFATGATELRSFIARSHSSDLLIWNDHLAGLLGVGAGIELNYQGEIDAAPSVVIEAGPNATVFLDGTEAGQGRTSLELKKPVSDLKVVWLSGSEYETKLRLRSALPGPTVIAPAIDDVPAPVSIQSAPARALVWLDGKFFGSTPIETSLVPGEYRLQLGLDGNWFPESTLTIAAGRRTETKISGEIASEVAVSHVPTGKGFALRFSSKKGSYSPPPGQKILLPAGDWTLAVDGAPDLAGVSIPVKVRETPVLIDLNDYKNTSLLKIVGLSEKSRIWVDEKSYPNPKSESIMLPTGPHRVFIWEDGFEALENTEINVRADGSSFIVFPRFKSHEQKGKTLRGISIGTGVSGGALLMLGSAILMLENAESNDEAILYRDGIPYYSTSSSDDEPSTGAGLAAFSICAGIGLEIWATISGVQSASELTKHKRQEAYKNKLEKLNE